jgi:hypothetical protein
MQQVRDAIERRDVDAAVSLFADDIVFRSPAVHAPYQGREQVEVLIRAVARVFEDFRYTHQIGASDAADHALVFRARIGDREVEGCDFIHVDENGLIDELFVMIRPLTGLIALAEAMQAQLAAADSAG